MKILRWILVTIMATALTTVAINAFDNIDNFGNSILGAVFLSVEDKRCPDDMTFVSSNDGDFCIDKYENSVGESCLYSDPTNKKQTDENLSFENCKPQSVKGAVPWRNIARHQAELACVKVGKRLPSSKEWYRAALGTADKNSNWGPNDCNVNNVGSNKPDEAGIRESCVSAAGAYDMIGNVWEWIDEMVYEGKYEEILLPNTGFIESISDKGIPLETDPVNPDLGFFEDYFWVESTEMRGVFRGGYWGNKSDAGQYAVNITVPPSFVGNAVGFRCVKNAN